MLDPNLFWKRLFTGTVPVNKAYLTGTVPVNKAYLTGTVPVNKVYLTGTVPVNKAYLTGTLFSQSVSLIHYLVLSVCLSVPVSLLSKRPS